MNTQMIDGFYGTIACHTSRGSGRPIVLIHGNSASSRAFLRQIGGPLGDKYRLIAIDLPGHGQSADAADPARYTIAGYAEVVTDIVERLGVADAVFIGWSLGGHILLKAASGLSKAKGFMIFGTPPLGSPPAMDRAFLPCPAMAFTFAPTLDTDQARDYVAAAFRPDVTDIPSMMVEDVLRTDGRARPQLLAGLADDSSYSETDVVAGLKQPLAILHGAQEQLVNGDYFDSLAIPTLWRGQVQVIEAAGHIAQWEQPEQFDALVEAFVADIG